MSMCLTFAVMQRISIHALREEGDRLSFFRRGLEPISIHALREEGDRRGQGQRFRAVISIHALREEGDINFLCYLHWFCHFYPRPPRGGRRGWNYINKSTYLFLSTPSARRATAGAPYLLARWDISIHALREEGDQMRF